MNKISVIIPVYNSGKYLEECLKSVLNQTYRDLEIICIDDGSTDNSPQICDTFSQIDSRVRVIHKLNEGVSATRNRGIELATGAWISFIDSDDTLEIDMYEKMIGLAVSKNVGIVHCGYNRVIDGEIRPIHGTNKIYEQSSDEAISCLISGRLFDGGLWNKLFSRKLISDLRFQVDLKNNEDILYNFEAFLRTDKIIFWDIPKYNYIARIGESSIFTVKAEKKMQDTVKVNQQIYEKLLGTSNRFLATERYIQSLSVLYRFYMNKNKAATKDIANKIWYIFQKNKSICKRMKITAWMIHLCPKIYVLLFSYYDKVRIPQWEAKKE